MNPERRSGMVSDPKKYFVCIRELYSQMHGRNTWATMKMTSCLRRTVLVDMAVDRNGVVGKPGVFGPVAREKRGPVAPDAEAGPGRALPAPRSRDVGEQSPPGIHSAGRRDPAQCQRHGAGPVAA